MSPRNSNQSPDSPGIYDGLLFAAFSAVVMGLVMLVFELIQSHGKVFG
jgi:hypothetical protein